MAMDHPIEPPPGSSREGQLRSAFTGILETLCESCHGALAALLVDEEGETVDLAAVTLVEMDGDDKVVRRMGGFDIKLSGAHWQIVLREAMSTMNLGGVRQLWVTTPSHGYIIKSLFEGYALVFVSRPDALYTVSSRALRQVEVELALEARWAVPDPEAPFWRRAKVRMDARGRPNLLRYAAGLDGSEEQDAEAWHPVRSLGPAKDFKGFEKAFDVVIGQGSKPRDVSADQADAPVTLVRERTGFWYAGLPVEQDASAIDF
jgi:hypothetical protein